MYEKPKSSFTLFPPDYRQFIVRPQHTYTHNSLVNSDSVANTRKFARNNSRTDPRKAAFGLQLMQVHTQNSESPFWFYERKPKFI